MARRRRNAEVLEATETLEIPVVTSSPSDYKAMAKSLQTHSITVTYPNGKKDTFSGYFSRRAANIDAKELTRQLRDSVDPSTYVTKTGKTRKVVPVKTKKIKKTGMESGYLFKASAGRADTKTRNPRKIRHNTHLPVGTSVDYKGKAAKVIAQHEHDHYTIRFASTGKTMRVPGFILVRR